MDTNYSLIILKVRVVQEIVHKNMKSYIMFSYQTEIKFLKCFCILVISNSKCSFKKPIYSLICLAFDHSPF